MLLSNASFLILLKLVNYFDKNKDGHVDIQEFMLGMEELAQNSSKKDYYRPLFAGKSIEISPSTH